MEPSRVRVRPRASTSPDDYTLVSRAGVVVERGGRFVVLERDREIASYDASEFTYTLTRAAD